MDKIYVIYWSQSGNTQAMAEAVGKGITDAGKEAVIVRAEDVSVADIADYCNLCLKQFKAGSAWKSLLLLRKIINTE